MTNTAWKLLQEWEIQRLMSALTSYVDKRTCQSLGIPSIRLDELKLATSPRGKADMRYLIDIVGAGHFLMLRF
jgi:hypothetical protein